MHDAEHKAGYDQEARYFAQKEREALSKLREKLESASDELQRREALGESLGTSTEAVLRMVEELGFDPQSARVMDLLPLISVAWADGNIQKRERELIHQLLDQRGIERGCEAWAIVEHWMRSPPSDHIFERVLAILRHVFAERGDSPADAVQLAARVAEVSGGFLGFGERVSDEERQILEHIAEELGPAATDALRREFHGRES